VPVILTTRMVRTGIRSVLGGNVLIRRIDKRYFFGIEFIDEGGFYLPYSDIEKTFIDYILFGRCHDKFLVKKMLKKIDKNKLASYLKHYPKLIQKKIMRSII